ncbi:MAG: hypothetical protein HY697_03450 [Deltaproteobacteria bacterium]|nr:hypothetical protein [Deltaproteobacteria bacterium]
MVESEWQKERDRRVVEIVRHFLLALGLFQEQLAKFRRGDLRFADLAKFIDDQGHSVLFALKRSCHNLFRLGNSSVSRREQLFDLTIGSIFHLAMKMREDLYQLEIYAPRYLDFNHKKAGSEGDKILSRQFKKIISRAEISFREGMEEISLLFGDIFRQFQELLSDYRENGLLLRFFLEEEQLLREVIGEGVLEKLFHTLFGGDEGLGYRRAGESYLESAFYAQAHQAFSRALQIRPDDLDLQFKIHLSCGLERFYSFAPEQALEAFECCLARPPEMDFPEFHRNLIRKVCLIIQEEFPGRRKGDQHRELLKKAQALQQQVEALPSRPEKPRP